MTSHSAKVGEGGANHPAHVRLVQRLLNDAIGRELGELLEVDGIAGARTISAIELFQRLNGLPVDGCIDPSGLTRRRPIAGHLTALSAGFAQSSFGRLGASSPPPRLVACVVSAYWELLTT